MDRINDAAQAADERRSGGRSQFGGRDRFGNQPAGAVTFDVGEIPDLTPLAGWALGGFALVLALLIGASVSGAWETVLLWIHRVPFSATSSVTDPIFGKDISYFLFELPFLRLVQGIFNGIVLATLILCLTRYLVGASRGGLVFSTPVRVHLAILGGLFLLSVAFGYQLDKLELSYSSRGVAAGVSFTDQNAQFFAFDVLTIISGMAAAFLVGGAFTRMIWPLGLTIGIWLVASVVIGRLYPEAVQRFTVAPNQYAQESPYIANNINMTRLAFDLGGGRTNRSPGPPSSRLPRSRPMPRPSPAPGCGTRGRSRPASTSCRPCASTTTSRTSTPTGTPSTTPSARSCSPRASSPPSRTPRRPAGSTSGSSTRTASGSRWCRSTRPTSQGQPNLLIGNLPPASVGGAPAITQPRIYFGERPSSYIVTGAQEDEFDYPTGDTDTGGSVGAQTRWTGTTGVKLDNTLMRLLFAARFRDLDLLISNQVTADSQLLFHRSIADRLGMIAPFLHYDKDPYIVIDGSGQLVYVQDAFTTSDRFPDAQPFDPGALDSTNLGSDSFNYIRNSVKITMNAYDGTMHFYVADPDDPIIRAYEGVFPSLFEPLSAMPADMKAHIRVPEELFNVQTRGVRPLPRHGHAAVLPQGRPVDRPDRRLERADAAVAGLLRRDAHAGRDRHRVPAPPADGPDQSTQHDRVGGGAERRRQLRVDAGLSIPGGHDDLRAGPDRGADRPGPDHQRPDLALEPVRAARSSAAT